MADEYIDTMESPATGYPDGGGTASSPHPDGDWQRPTMYRAVVEIAADESLLDDPDAVRDLVEDVVAEFGFELVSYDTTRFAPIGVTGIGVIGESHISVHTWPEHGYAHVELLTCSPLPGAEELRRRFPLEDSRLVEVRRGDP